MTSSASGAAALMVLRSLYRAARNLGGTRARYSSIVFGAGSPLGAITTAPLAGVLRVRPRPYQDRASMPHSPTTNRAACSTSGRSDPSARPFQFPVSTRSDEPIRTVSPPRTPRMYPCCTVSVWPSPFPRSCQAPAEPRPPGGESPMVIKEGACPCTFDLPPFHGDHDLSPSV